MAHVRALGAFLESDHGFLDALVLDGRAGVLAQMFGPRADEEGLAEVRGISEIGEERAAEGTVAQPRLAECARGVAKVAGLRLGRGGSPARPSARSPKWGVGGNALGSVWGGV